jgi:hypothetical protein
MIATDPTTPPGSAIQSPPCATDANEDDPMSNSWLSALDAADNGHHASSPEPQAAPKDTGTSFLTFYYCVHCGEGPYHISRSPYCPDCFPLSDTSQYNSHDHDSTGKPNTFHELIDPKYKTPYRQPYGQRRYCSPLVYLWVCCACGSHNSYKIDQGCAECCNHWRCSHCILYDTNS